MSNGFRPEQPLQVRKTIVESENGKKYTLEVLDNKASVSYQVDGNIIKEGEKCDKLILVKYCDDEWAEIIRDVENGELVDSIYETLKKEAISVDEDFYVEFKFDGFSVSWGYASYNI